MKRAAEFVKALRLNNLDENTIQKAKDCLLDFLGAALGGKQTKSSQIVLRFVNSLNTPGKATIWCTGDKTSCVNATLVNGTIGQSLDIDDGHRMAVGHPGCVVIPAALAVAEHVNATGRELLEAVICGYEVGIRAGNVQYLSQSSPTEVFGSGRFGAIAAATAAAKLLCSKIETIEQALAISATFAPVALIINFFKETLMPMTKVSSGWGSMVGVSSSFLAKEGFTGVSSSTHFALSQLPDFGKSFEINGTYFKPYPSCRWTHPSIEGTLELINKHNNLNKGNIKRIMVKTFANAAQLREYRPKTIESAQYSLPFLVAAAIVDKKVTLQQVNEERLLDPDIINVAEKIDIVHSPELDKLFPEKVTAEIEIESISGELYNTRITVPKGDPKNPLTKGELNDKFRLLAKQSISPQASERVIAIVDKLEELPDLTELTSTLCNK